MKHDRSPTRDRALAYRVGVLHKWSSVADLHALDLLREAAAPSADVVDLPFEGDIGDAVREAIAGGEPFFVKMHGQDLPLRREAADLTGIFPAAALATVPEAVKRLMQVGDRLVGIPVGLHQANLLYANLEALAATRRHLPRAWSDLAATCDVLAHETVRPFALGRDWMTLGLLFENLVLSTGGAEFYRRTLVDCDPAALASDTMTEALRRWIEIKGTVASQDAPWRELAAEVKAGAATFMAIADFAASAFEDDTGVAVAALDFPGTAGAFIFVADFFTPFGFAGAGGRRLLRDIVESWTSIPVAQAFAAAKGAVPARLDAAQSGDDMRSRTAEACRAAAMNRSLLPSLTLEQAAPEPVRRVFLDALARAVDSDVKGSELQGMILAGLRGLR